VNHLLQLLFDNARDYAIFTLNPKGHISSWNQGAEAILGFTEKEIIGKHAGIIFLPEDRAAGMPETELFEALSKGQSKDERWHIRKDGSQFWASGMLILLRGADGQVKGYAKILRDRTENKSRQSKQEMNLSPWPLMS